VGRSKLSWHFQGMDNQVAALVNSEYVKIMDPPAQNPFPQCKVIARFHLDEGAKEEMVRRGAQGGREWFEYLRPRMAARPWVHAVETWNEPLGIGLFDPAQRARFVAASIEFLRLAHGAGWRVVWGNFSVGQPPEGAWRDFLEVIDALGPEDMLGLHEYGWPRMDAMLDAGHPGEGWWCLRYRKVARWLAERGRRMPRTLIGECGLDRLLINQVGGWMATVDNQVNLEEARRRYFEQLVWYDQELGRDEYIVAATPFTAAAGHPWESYAVDVELSRMTHNHIEATKTVSTETARGFDASKYQAAVNWDLVRRAGFSFCILRASGPNQWPAYTGLEVDRALDSHWRGAGSIGLLRGAYHFLLPDVEGQAAFFAQALGGRRFELPVYADVEVGGTTAEKVRSFLEAADRNTGRRVGVYTNQALWRNLGMAGWMGGRSLWAARWGTSEPAWNYPWEFWQYDVADAGTVPGFGGRLDLNWYNGTVAQLRAKYGAVAPEPPVIIEPEIPEEPAVLDEEETVTEIDPRIAAWVSVTGAPAGALYRLARVGWKNEAESQGRHHIYIDVVDGEGRRLAGERVTMTWAGGSSVGVVEEKPGEPFGANFPMNAALGSYGAFAGTDPALSDRVSGMGLGTPEHPGTLIHTSFELVFVKGAEVVPPVVPPEPEPEPEPEEPGEVIGWLREARDLLDQAIEELEG